MVRLLLLIPVVLILGCPPEPDGGLVPLSFLTLADLRIREPTVVCGAAEYPALIGTYEVENTIPAGTGHWQFYVGAVVVQPVTGMFDVRIRGTDDYYASLEPGESATVEIWALNEPAPGQRVEFRVHYHFVPAADADADAGTAALYATELGSELVEFTWDCP